MGDILLVALGVWWVVFFCFLYLQPLVLSKSKVTNSEIFILIIFMFILKGIRNKCTVAGCISVIILLSCVLILSGSFLSYFVC